MCFAFLWVPASAGMTVGGSAGMTEGCAGMTGEGAGRMEGASGRMGFVHPHPNPLPSRERGCTRSRLRGNEGGTGGNEGLFTLTLGPPLNLPLGGGGRWLEGEGMYPVPPARE